MPWRACCEARRDYYVVKIKHFPFTVPELQSSVWSKSDYWGVETSLARASTTANNHYYYFFILNHSRKFLASLTINTAWTVFVFKDLRKN